MARSDSSKDSSSASSKKVAKAAKAGATPQSSAGRESRSLGFPMALTAVMVLGTALVAFAWSGRDAAALTPTFGDHWHIPYGVYDCTEDAFLEPFADPGPDPDGIHSHGDGVVHLHPFSSRATGNNATLGLFFEYVDEELSDDAITFPDRPALSEEGAECDGEPAILQVVTFPVQLNGEPRNAEMVSVLTEDLASYQFDNDFQPFTIALAPEGAEIPTPPESAFEAAYGSSPNVFSTSGLEGLTDLDLEGDGTPTFGFDEDGVLVDADGEPILDANGEEITNTPTEDEGGDAETDAEDSEESEE